MYANDGTFIWKEGQDVTFVRVGITPDNKKEVRSTVLLGSSLILQAFVFGIPKKKVVNGKGKLAGDPPIHVCAGYESERVFQAVQVLKP